MYQTQVTVWHLFNFLGWSLEEIWKYFFNQCLTQICLFSTKIIFTTFLSNQFQYQTATYVISTQHIRTDNLMWKAVCKAEYLTLVSNLTLSWHILPVSSKTLDEWRVQNAGSRRRKRATGSQHPTCGQRKGHLQGVKFKDGAAGWCAAVSRPTCGSPNSQCADIWGWAFGRSLSFNADMRVGPPLWEKRKRDESLLSLQFLRTQWESSWQASKRALPGNKLAGTLILDFSASRTVRNGHCLSYYVYFFIGTWVDYDTGETARQGGGNLGESVKCLLWLESQGIKSRCSTEPKAPEIQQAKWPGVLRRPGCTKGPHWHRLAGTDLLTVRQ